MNDTRACTIWGDGFADDEWQDMVLADRWSSIHPDEYIRLFPRLVASGEPPSTVLADHLENALAVRLWRLTRRGSRTPALAPGLLARGAQREGDWFGRSSWLRRTVDRLWMGDGAAGAATASDEAAVAALDPLASALRRGQMPLFTELHALAVAFYGGLHPAYLWAEALPIHDCATVAGWLGVLARGRRALLPLDVATILAESVDQRDGRTSRLRDGRLAFCNLTPHQWMTIGDAARRRLDGRREAVRLPAPRRIDPLAGSYPETAAIPANASPH